MYIILQLMYIYIYTRTSTHSRCPFHAALKTPNEDWMFF